MYIVTLRYALLKSRLSKVSQMHILKYIQVFRKGFESGDHVLYIRTIIKWHIFLSMYTWIPWILSYTIVSCRS